MTKLEHRGYPRGSIAALLDDLNERRAKIQADQTLSTKERNRLIRAAQAFLAQALAEGLDLALPAPEPPPRRPWWGFWRWLET